MTFKHITELRKNGQLEEAYQEAKSDFDADKENIWTRRACAWVLYEFLKRDLETKQWSDFDCRISEIGKLELPTDEHLFFDQLAWQIAKRINTLEDMDNDGCSRIFKLISGFRFQPSAGYSYLFRTFHKQRGNWSDYINFCDWWNFDKFMPEDYESFTTENKQKVMSLAEQAHIGYANALLCLHDNLRIEAFLPRLENLMSKHPEYKYPLYFKSKLLLHIGKKQEAFDTLLPFVKTKANDFWVWQILGDATSDPNIAFSCYSRALTCPCMPQMLVKIKEQYATMLLKKGLYSEAKTEILHVLSTREKNGWRATEFLQHIQTEDWFGETSEKRSNAELYERFADDAENAVYTNSCKEGLVITSINHEKQTASFITLHLVSGFFRFKTILKSTPKVGETYTAKFSELKEGRNCQLLSIKKDEDKNNWTNNLCHFSGLLKQMQGKPFGIVVGERQVFVQAQLMKGINDGDNVKGTAVKSFDKHKNKEGWTALTIQSI
ncbi:MAG: hypothetical protein WCU80_12315 [Paludibacteraceae bacterium]